MNRTVQKVDRIVNRIVDFVLMVLFIMIFLMVFNQVVLRYIFNTSIMGTAEVFTMLFTYCSALGAASMLRHREHIKIAVFLDKLPLKVKKVVVTINYILIGIFCFFVFKESLPWLNSIKTFRSQVTGISRAVESITIPIAFGLMVFYCIYNIFIIYLNPEELHLESSEADLEVKELLQEAEEADRIAREREEREKNNDQGDLS
ncbi:MAG: TRAP transporter small permease [Spirochaetales bacterium]|nr:TRAP transporter small permease [Spirochaetales bacterium]